MKTNLKRQDYRKYAWKWNELVVTALFCTGVVGVMGYFFYRSVWALLPLSGVGVWLFWQSGCQKAVERRERLTEQFRECILAVATSLQAGYSVENAFLECGQDMKLLYGEDADICRELVCIKRGLRINLSLEELLLDLAERSGCDDVEQFAKVFSQAKRSGGNMAEIIRNTAARIGKKMELQKEIQMQLSGRKMELNIMKLIPFGILFYINLGNPGYFDGLYHNLPGVLIMTVCLAVYLAAVVLGERIMNGIMEK